MTKQHFNSTDDAREGNSMRGNYRKLTDREKILVDELKAKGEELVHLLKTARLDQNGRELALATTKVEEAIMWAVKGVTK